MQIFRIQLNINSAYKNSLVTVNIDNLDGVTIPLTVLNRKKKIKIQKDFQCLCGGWQNKWLKSDQPLEMKS